MNKIINIEMKLTWYRTKYSYSVTQRTTLFPKYIITIENWQIQKNNYLKLQKINRNK